MTKFATVALLTGALLATSAHAATPALTINETAGSPLSNGPFTLGWNFTVRKAIKVTGLGVFDDLQNGLAQSHDVGIWDSSAALIVSATVPNGTAGTLINQFRYVGASAILTPGNYRIGAVWLDGADPLVFNATGIATISDIVYTRGNFIAGGTLAFPSSSIAQDGFFGPNFTAGAVPEPESWVLMIGGFGLIGAAMRRRRPVMAA